MNKFHARSSKLLRIVIMMSERSNERQLSAYKKKYPTYIKNAKRKEFNKRTLSVSACR